MTTDQPNPSHRMTPAIFTGMHCQAPPMQALHALHACGWTCFEIASEHLVAIDTAPDPAASIQETRTTLRELHVTTPQAHAWLDADVAHPHAAQRTASVETFLRHTRIAAQLGVSCVVMHPGGRCAPEDQPSVRRRNLESFRRIGACAGELGLRVGLENLTIPGATQPQELIDLVEALGAPFGIVLDTSHAHMSGIDLPAMIRTIGPLLLGTHISDNHGASDEHLTPGRGTIDWPAVMAAFADISYTGPFNLEVGGDRHLVPALLRLHTIHALAVTRWLLSLP